MLKYLFGLAFLPILIACNQNTAENIQNFDTDTFSQELSDEYYVIENTCDSIIEFSRDSILESLIFKIQNDIPLVVHIFVPLCDNENQGIVPVNSSLGDGMNLNTNLYWGAGYGIRTHFKRLNEWDNISFVKDINSDILERAVFYKEYTNKAKVYLIADAYRGDRMKESIEAYLNTVAGNNYDILTNESGEMIPIGSNADLLIFNGHNGMMDSDIGFFVNVDGIEKDVVAIACASSVYFEQYFSCAKGYPLVTTTNLLAPEAYIVKAIIDNWAMLRSAEEIRQSAGDAYHNIHKCGQNGARRLFKTGW